MLKTKPFLGLGRFSSFFLWTFVVHALAQAQGSACFLLDFMLVSEENVDQVLNLEFYPSDRNFL